jgi:hypothetical protein
MALLPPYGCLLWSNGRFLDAILGTVDILTFRLFCLKNPNKTMSKEVSTPLSQQKKLPESRRDSLSKRQQALAIIKNN